MKPVTLSQMAAFFYTTAGRASRREYALGMAFLFFLSGAISNILLARMLPEALGALPADTELTDEVLLQVIISLAFQMWYIYLPLNATMIVLSIRRAHDFGMPGVLTFLLFLFFAVFLIVPLFVIRGNPDANRYGPPPRYVK